MELKEKLRSLPSCPGVYLMKDSRGNVIYVGKSKNLKNRVGSYFQSSASHTPKTVKLVRSIKDFDYIVTDTEFEAFLLENRLIKEIKPMYNKLLKSPKSYTYIKINMAETYPSINASAERDSSGGSIYFGPYTNRNTVERALLGIKETCRISCSGSPQKASPCFNYSLGLCIGICMGDGCREQYSSIVHKIIGLLDGTDNSILSEMEAIMENASEKLSFETAAKYRDYIGAVRSLVRKAKVLKYTERNRNIMVLEPLDNGCVKFFLINNNKLLFSEKYSLEDYSQKELVDTLSDIVFAAFSSIPPAGPAETEKEAFDEAQIIFSYLSNKSGRCRHAVVPKSWLKAAAAEKIKEALYKLLP